MAATAAMSVTPKVIAPMVSGMLVEPGGATAEERRKQSSDGSPDILPNGHRRDPGLGLEEFGE